MIILWGGNLRNLKHCFASYLSDMLTVCWELCMSLSLRWPVWGGRAQCDTCISVEEGSCSMMVLAVKCISHKTCSQLSGLEKSQGPTLQWSGSGTLYEGRECTARNVWGSVTLPEVTQHLNPLFLFNSMSIIVYYYNDMTDDIFACPHYLYAKDNNAFSVINATWSF